MSLNDYSRRAVISAVSEEGVVEVLREIANQFVSDAKNGGSNKLKVTWTFVAMCIRDAADTIENTTEQTGESTDHDYQSECLTGSSREAPDFKHKDYTKSVTTTKADWERSAPVHAEEQTVSEGEVKKQADVYEDTCPI